MASAFFRIIVPRIPLILKSAVVHVAGATPESQLWDLRLSVIVPLLRSIMATSTSTISQQQAFSLRPVPERDDVWVAPVTVPAPAEDDLRQLLFGGIEEMAEKGEAPPDYERPEAVDVECEWNGHRSASSSASASASTAAKYTSLMSETTSSTTILYFHGGAYYLMDPATHRPTTAKLCKLTGGRALSVRYRLAPGHPFPAAVLDCLIAYLGLLYPPEGALHDAVDPKDVVFAGDSAGGNMCFALTLFLLHVRRMGREKVLWNGREVELALPAGLAANSPWLDITRSLPSLARNAHYDYIPPSYTSITLDAPSSPSPNTKPSRQETETTPREVSPTPTFLPSDSPPPCPLFPSPPPRADIYSPNALLRHALVSPLSAGPQLWRGCPPVVCVAGEEMLEDEIRVVCRRIALADASTSTSTSTFASRSASTPPASAENTVRLTIYEAMPHVFCALLAGTPAGEHCFAEWAGGIQGILALAASSTGAASATGGRAETERLATGAEFVRAKTFAREELPMEDLTALTDEQVDAHMRRAEAARLRRWEGMCADAGSSVTSASASAARDGQVNGHGEGKARL